MVDIFFLSWMNIQEDLYDLCNTFNSSHPHKKPFGTGSCSVLIKLLPGHKELYMSHVTWNWYLNNIETVVMRA